MKITRQILSLLIYILFVGLILMESCGTADLRTSTVINQPDPEKGRELLALSYNAHNAEAWNKLETYECIFQDTFFGFIGKYGNPYPGNGAEMRMHYIPGTFDGRVVFEKGKWKDKVWGLQAWRSYHGEVGTAVEFKKDNDIIFWLPTYQYFIELPLRIKDATFISYAGQAARNGQTYELVFASWNTAKPQRDIDQYIVWVNAETYLVERVEYTVRDQYNFLTGAVDYLEYQDFDGIPIPTFMPVESNLVKKGLLHEMRILDFKSNPVTISELYPDSTLPIMGDEKPD